MLAATRELLAEGDSSSVEKAADRAAISRTTAYRYFPNQRTLLIASYPDLDAPSLLEDAPTSDASARLELVTEALTRQLLEREPEMRPCWPLLESPPRHKDALPLRQGRAIGWIDDALAPLRDRIPASELRRLVLAIRATLGIEALVWLTDIAGLPRDEATRHSCAPQPTHSPQSAIADDIRTRAVVAQARSSRQAQVLRR